ncbi:M23 family metallopeptidase [Streptomyces aidingensis]|uniref:Peptidase family M23 n=1 Tax=Streptomyces aidingensis TaxID=910347 RepID=A0A1I1MH64_9ACTN|nr:M23 family metallopeptidase [Streptomyces aidingensis]SFC81973.1 Peptidase family M23 [Streptomyces aidingensis]
MLSRTARTAVLSRVRTRTGVVTAGVVASLAIAGTGVAAAAETPSADVFAAGPGALAQYTVNQAEIQTKAAEVEAKQAAEVKQAATASWVSPISDGYTLSATFGNSGDRWAAGHSGQDFAVPTGTPVKAVHGGTVVKAGGNGAGDGSAYGNAIVVKHASGTYSQYAHLSSVKVSVGQEVETGDTIGMSGNTGNSTGPHLHFEIRTTPDYGSAVDPAKFLRDHGVKL